MRRRLLTVVSAAALTTVALPAAAATASTPTVTRVAPSYGPTAGGTHVTITGHNFDAVQAVRFGGVDASFHRVSSTRLTATTPAHAVGQVSVAVVTASGRGVAKAAFDYAKPAAPPVGAGYLVPHTDAKAAVMRLVVPKLTCAPHETAGIGATVQPVRRLAADDHWVASVSFRCSDGVASYHSFLACGLGGGSAGPRPHPGDRVELYYDRTTTVVQLDRGNSGTATVCTSSSADHSTTRSTNEPRIAFLVATASTPPTSLRSLTVHVTVAGGTLSAAHPSRQSQPVPFRRQLHAGPIASDGKTFTVTLRTQ